MGEHHYLEAVIPHILGCTLVTLRKNSAEFRAFALHAEGPLAVGVPAGKQSHQVPVIPRKEELREFVIEDYITVAGICNPNISLPIDRSRIGQTYRVIRRDR